VGSSDQSSVVRSNGESDEFTFLSNRSNRAAGNETVKDRENDIQRYTDVYFFINAE
jgi:hypothetical protein